jgi:uncharacterized protein
VQKGKSAPSEEVRCLFKFGEMLCLFLIRFYQVLISPLKKPTCRFYPSCSRYFYGAVKRHGLIKGSIMGSKRILRCHPFHPGGYDPVR